MIASASSTSWKAKPVKIPYLHDFAKLPKVLRPFEDVLVAELHGKAHHIDQISLHDSDILQENIKR